MTTASTSLILIGKERTLPVLEYLKSRLSGHLRVETEVFRDLIPKYYTKSKRPDKKAVAIADYMTSTKEIPDDVYVLGIGFAAEKLDDTDHETGDELLSPDSKKHFDELLIQLAGRDFRLNVGCSLLSKDMPIAANFVVRENLCVRSLSPDERKAFVADIPKQQLGKIGPAFPFRETDRWRALLQEPDSDIEIITEQMLRKLAERDDALGKAMLSALVTTQVE